MVCLLVNYFIRWWNIEDSQSNFQFGTQQVHDICIKFPDFCKMVNVLGQERFKNISSAYYRGAHGVVLVYDITSQKSLDHLDTWLEELDKYDSEDKEKMMVRLVVGNKSDQAHARQVESEKGMLWAEQRGISFLGMHKFIYIKIINY